MADASADGPIILERYRLMRQLGQGGMGAVYMAQHIHLGSTHAVKAMRPQGGLLPDQLAQLEARFLREAKICGMVKHPNLVPVTDFGTTEGVPYIVMDFIDGKDLQEIVDAKGALPEEEALKMTRDVASALGALHNSGIVHRDMKPANVMIEKITGRVVLTDLGIAKDSTSSAQLTQGIMGTPAFMAPEQVADTTTAGPESDIYSLGATLYTVLVGKPPFEGDNPISVIQAAQQNLFAFTSLAGVSKERDNRPFKPDIDRLLHGMTTYERNDRMKTMAEVVSMVSQILNARADTSQGAADITMPFGSDEVASAPMQPPATAQGTRPPTSAPAQRPPTGAGTAPPRPATAAPPPQQRPPTNAPQPAPRPGESSVQKSVLVALSEEDVSAGGNKGMMAVVVLIVLAGLVGGGYFAAQKGIINIPGITQGTANDSTPDVSQKAPDDSTAADTVASGAGDTDTTTVPADTGAAVITPVAEADPDALDEASAPAAVSIPLLGADPLVLLLVKAGTFTVGTAGGDNVSEQPATSITITKSFYIGKYEVTVGQYAAFLKAVPPRSSTAKTMDLDAMGLVADGDGWKPAEGAAKTPIRSLPHLMARRFCEWVGEVGGIEADLPGEVEWEYAARGPKSPIYPWGNDWEDGLACVGEGIEAPAEVGTYKDSVSWCGAMDMTGNVFEWTADEYVKDRYASIEAVDPAVAGADSSSGFRVIRGGCFGNDEYVCRAAHRMGMKGSKVEAALGFRVRAAATKGILTHAAKQD